MKHELKTATKYFVDLWAGRKTFELRYNDRNYQTGDTLDMLEGMYVSAPGMPGFAYTGRSIAATVTHILRGNDTPGLSPGHPLAPDWVILSLRIDSRAINGHTTRPITAWAEKHAEGPGREIQEWVESAASLPTHIPAGSSFKTPPYMVEPLRQATAGETPRRLIPAHQDTEQVEQNVRDILLRHRVTFAPGCDSDVVHKLAVNLAGYAHGLQDAAEQRERAAAGIKPKKLGNYSARATRILAAAGLWPELSYYGALHSAIVGLAHEVSQEGQTFANASKWPQGPKRPAERAVPPLVPLQSIARAYTSEQVREALAEIVAGSITHCEMMDGLEQYVEDVQTATTQRVTNELNMLLRDGEWMQEGNALRWRPKGRTFAELQNDLMADIAKHTGLPFSFFYAVNIGEIVKMLENGRRHDNSPMFCALLASAKAFAMKGPRRIDWSLPYSRRSR